MKHYTSKYAALLTVVATVSVASLVSAADMSGFNYPARQLLPAAWKASWSPDSKNLAFSPDGTMLAVTKGFGMVSLWDVATGKEIKSWRAHTTIAKGLCFSPDGKQLATTSHAHDPKLWDAKTGSLIVALER